jgi:hypothetical protein
MLAAAGMNFKRMMNIYKNNAFGFLSRFFLFIYHALSGYTADIDHPILA